jgi:hypothetical protein
MRNRSLVTAFESGEGRLERSGHIAGFSAVMASCLFGVLGSSFWGPCAAAVVLVLLSIGLHEPIYARYERAHEVHAQSLLLLASVMNAALTVAAAYVAGVAIGWAWVG